jgi:hypothetical protein
VLEDESVVLAFKDEDGAAAVSAIAVARTDAK